jgi:hypothetical protein
MTPLAGEALTARAYGRGAGGLLHALKGSIELVETDVHVRHVFDTPKLVSRARRHTRAVKERERGTDNMYYDYKKDASKL